jgi:hypothetical protein
MNTPALMSGARKYTMADIVEMTPNCLAGYLDYRAIPRKTKKPAKDNPRLRQKSLNGKRLDKDKMCLRLGLWLKEMPFMIHLKSELGILDQKGLFLMHRTELDAQEIRTSFKANASYSKLNYEFHAFLKQLFTVTKATKIEYLLLRTKPRYVEIDIIMPLHDIPYPMIFLKQLLHHLEHDRS